jgi:hypothetical protein
MKSGKQKRIQLKLARMKRAQKKYVLERRAKSKEVSAGTAPCNSSLLAPIIVFPIRYLFFAVIIATFCSDARIAEQRKSGQRRVKSGGTRLQRGTFGPQRSGAMPVVERNGKDEIKPGKLIWTECYESAGSTPNDAQTQQSQAAIIFVIGSVPPTVAIVGHGLPAADLR